jgi:uncharacterized membrane protein YgcG
MFDVIPAEGWAVITLFVLFVARLAFEIRRGDRQRAEKDEALFRSMFPDLLPLFHPRNVLAYIKARIAQGPPPWKDPPVFPGADTTETEVVAARERITLRAVSHEHVILRDAAGAILARFVLEPIPDGMALRVGKGKFTVDRRYNEVKYWHPDRQFKWTPPDVWRFTSALAEGAISSGDASGSSPTSTGSSRDLQGTAAPFAGAGGAFDGGGASHAWSAPGATAY